VQLVRSDILRPACRRRRRHRRRRHRRRRRCHKRKTKIETAAAARCVFWSGRASAMPNHGSGRSPTRCVFIRSQRRQLSFSPQHRFRHFNGAAVTPAAGTCLPGRGRKRPGSRGSCIQRHSDGRCAYRSRCRLLNAVWRVDRSPVIGLQSRSESFILRHRSLHTGSVFKSNQLGAPCCRPNCDADQRNTTCRYYRHHTVLYCCSVFEQLYSPDIW